MKCYNTVDSSFRSETVVERGENCSCRRFIGRSGSILATKKMSLYQQGAEKQLAANISLEITRLMGRASIGFSLHEVAMKRNRQVFQ